MTVSPDPSNSASGTGPGDVIDAKPRKIVTTLQDENGKDVQSEKLLEIDFANGKLVRAGDQFGIGRVGVGK